MTNKMFALKDQLATTHLTYGTSHALMAML